MAIKKNNYINVELKWAEKQLLNWKKYVDTHPVHTLQDRIEWVETRGGSVPKVIASIESQGKFIQETMKNYLALLAEVNNMREVEESKKQARGSAVVPHRMQ